MRLGVFDTRSRLLVAAALSLCSLAGASSALAAGQMKIKCNTPATSKKCTVVIAVSAADNNTQVVIVTPRRSLGSYITANRRNVSVMYDVETDSTGMSFTLQNTPSAPPGTKITIVFTLAPFGTRSPPHAPSPPPPPLPAGSGKSSISLRAPSSNKVGKKFPLKISGVIGAPVDFVAFDLSGTTCASAPSTYHHKPPAVNQVLQAGRSFTVTFHLTASAPGSYVFCAYLVATTKTHATIARALAHWVNHR